MSEYDYPLQHKLLPYPVKYVPAHSSAEGFAERQRERLRQAQKVVPIRRKA